MRAHKEQWLTICRERPEVFTEPTRSADVGPIQALVDELEYNQGVAAAAHTTQFEPCAPFLDEQFKRALGGGAVSMLDERLKPLVLAAYRKIGEANQANAMAASLGGNYQGGANVFARAARDSVTAALAALYQFSGAADAVLRRGDDAFGA